MIDPDGRKSTRVIIHDINSVEWIKEDPQAFQNLKDWGYIDLLEAAHRKSKDEDMTAYKDLEDQVKAVGADVAPRITPSHIKSVIASEHYFTAADGVCCSSSGGLVAGFDVKNYPSHPLNLLTFCVLVLKNGFTVVGESACASPENFNADIGKRVARENAESKIWKLEGYLLRQHRSLIEQAGAAQGKITELGEAKTYAGTKVIHAVPMSRGAYNQFRGWTLPADEKTDDEGYLVQYVGNEPSNIDGFTGYVSWSPKNVFEQAYTT